MIPMNIRNTTKHTNGQIFLSKSTLIIHCYLHDHSYFKYHVMKEILTALMIWLGANTSLSTNFDTPRVIFLPQQQLEQMFYGDNEHLPDALHGMYHKDQDNIYLPDTWDRRSAWDMGVLVHEMVHYLQDMNEMKFNCSQEMEKMAWPIQQKYLKQKHNYDWDYDKLWFTMISNCNYGH